MAIKRVEMRVKPPEPDTGRTVVLAIADIVIDSPCLGELWIREIRIVQGRDNPYLAMPNRRVTVHCVHCDRIANCDYRFCGYCGGQLEPKQFLTAEEKRASYLDLCHPRDLKSRRTLEEIVLRCYYTARRQFPVSGSWSSHRSDTAEVELV